MAYPAVISLEQTLDCLLNCIDISLLSPSHHEILKYTCHKVDNLLENNLGDLDKPTMARAAEKYMEALKEAARKVEDAIGTHVSNHLLLQSDDESLGDKSRSLEVSQDLEQVIKAMYSFKETMENILQFSSDNNEGGGEEEEEEEEEDDNDVSSIPDFARNKLKNHVIGLSNTFFNELKAQLLQSDESARNNFTIVGMAGIGKTTVAMKILEDPSIRNHFDHCVFVTIGQKYQARRVMQNILSQLKTDIHDLHMQSEQELRKNLSISLKGTRFLIVADDVWDDNDMYCFLRVVKCCVEFKILITTRLLNVAEDFSWQYGIYQMRFLNDKESWDLLRQEVFGEHKLCPYELEKAGKKIAEICDGLPLAIVTVARLLSKAEKTPEYWNKVAEKQNSLFTNAYDAMFKVLLPSYKYLPLFLKPCFLYMGVFPLNYHIPISKLIDLWYVEGLLSEKLIGKAREYEAFAREHCLAILVSSNVIQVRQLNSYTNGYKSCSLHSVFWHFCIKQAGMELFFHFIDGHAANTIAEDMKRQRRLCIHKNILFSIEKVCKSIEFSSTVRSLLCTGPNHEYPLPISFGRLWLLRVLNALTIRFYDFPMELVKLLELRYLALTCNRKLPASISKLRNLEYLIVHPHMSIKYPGSPSYLPMEIWDMKELKHLQVMGRDLPEPDPNSGDDALLPNLVRLLGVSHHSCTEGILKRTPNLTKLGIQIELSPDNVETLCCFDHLSYLSELKSVKCVIMNPNNPMSSQVVSFPASPQIFPSSLQKLSLSGSGYPWECMRIIAELPNLKGLKLHGYAFQGPEWIINKGQFEKLCSLLIEDTDLVHLIVEDACFGNLLRLTIRHCYKLKEIPLIQKRHDLHILEIVDCPSAVASTKQLKEKQLELGNDTVYVYGHSSWRDAAPKKSPPIDINSYKWAWD